MNVVTVVVLAVVVLGAAFVLFQVVRQQGRLLLRIEELEGLLGVGGQRTGALGAAAHGSHAVGTPVGLPVGSTLEPVTLHDLDGNDVALEGFRGKQMILVNWSPTCGFCDAIAPDLASAAPALEEANATLVLLAHGDAAANRAMVEKYKIESPILLLGDANPAGFQALGTPTAVLVDAEGKVATSLAIGADQVPLLVQDVAAAGGPGDAEDTAEGAGDAADGDVSPKLRGMRNLSESRLVRDGLKAGTPAPPFSLPDLDGKPVALEDYRGKQVLLTFISPDCGPCDALAPHLARLHREHAGNGLAVILVGRGDVEENRKKAAEHGFEFPVVLQEGWKLSREYGIFATPVAFLIDEQGTISRNVAQGVDQIVALVPSSGSGADRR